MVGVVAALLVSCLPRPTFQLLAVVLWRYLAVLKKHFVLPLCLVVTAALASVLVLSLKAGCGLALALCVVGRLPFGKRKQPWQLWLQCSGLQGELERQAKAACPGTPANGLGLTAEQRSFL